MKRTQTIMTMPVVVVIDDREATPELFEEVFAYVQSVDERFSFFKPTSEISAVNRGELAPEAWSADLKEIFTLAEDTRRVTGGYFNIITPGGLINPSGLVKGWAIDRAAKLLSARGVKNFSIEIAGDIAVSGLNEQGEPWCIGIENPLAPQPTEAGAGTGTGGRREVVKIVQLSNKGIATSGTYRNGAHIYNPLTKRPPEPESDESEILSLAVIGPNVYEADRFATAAFAMGRPGIEFIERLDGFEAYQIDVAGIATMTSGFQAFVV